MSHFQQSGHSEWPKELALATMLLPLLHGLIGCSPTQTPSAGAQATVALSFQDETAVRAIVAEFANTWNRHDMQAMHELDTDDVEWINVAGNHCGNRLTYQ